MDIKAMIKNICQRVSNETKAIWKKVVGFVTNQRNNETKWAVGGVLVLVVCVGVGVYKYHSGVVSKPCVVNEEGCEDGADKTALFEAQLTSTEQRLASIEQKLDALSSNQEAKTIESEVRRQIARENEIKEKKKKVLHKLLAEVSDGRK